VATPDQGGVRRGHPAARAQLVATGAVFQLSDRRHRARCYEVVLREGTPADILGIVDGALLVDLWPDLVLPREVRDAWQPIIDEVIS
jgi:hypothetical protein